MKTVLREVLLAALDVLRGVAIGLVVATVVCAAAIIAAGLLP